MYSARAILESQIESALHTIPVTLQSINIKSSEPSGDFLYPVIR